MSPIKSISATPVSKREFLMRSNVALWLLSEKTIYISYFPPVGMLIFWPTKSESTVAPLLYCATA